MFFKQCAIEGCDPYKKLLKIVSDYHTIAVDVDIRDEVVNDDYIP